MDRSTLLHLRFPFSYYLLPVFLFAFSISYNFSWRDFLLCFLIVHFLLYPASNGYNSYFDRDEQSIGGLKYPPKVTKSLYYTSLILDLVALIVSYIFINSLFATMLLIYGMGSKSYSHPMIRLKKYPIVGWLTIFVFQGYYSFIMMYVGINSIGLQNIFTYEVQTPAILSSIFLGGSYPMTQIYQHGEDRKRGDITLSLILGTRGTFHFTALMFTLATAGFLYYFLVFFEWWYFLVFQAILLPGVVYFIIWYFAVRRDPSNADYDSTMKLNRISATSMNIFFVLQWVIGYTG